MATVNNSETILSSSSKRRLRKKNLIKNKNKNNTDVDFHQQLRDEAVKHWFDKNPSAIKIFGTDSMKMANYFADQCVSELKKA
jgi:hypothetical protein